MILETLLPEGRRLLTREFLHGDRPRWTDEECQEFVRPLPRLIELGAFHAALRRKLPRIKADVDRDLAADLHRSLPLRRREAADPGVWRYLAIVAAPEFIRLRWSAEEDTFRSRFWRAGARPDSNYYSRLWWIAELTAGPDQDYSRTRIALTAQALATAIFVRSFSHYYPAVKAFIDVLGEEPGDLCARAGLELHRELALRPREALTAEDISEYLRDLLRRLRGS